MVDPHADPADDPDRPRILRTPPISSELTDSAIELVYGQRHADYGDPERNLKKIGMVWGAMLGVEPIDPRTVAVMMVGMKMIRASGRMNRDDLVDAVGYLLLADEASQ